MFHKIVFDFLFLVYALFLVALFGFRKLISKNSLTVFILGMLSFGSIFIIQVPIQKLLSNSVFFYNLSDILKAILYASVAGFIQEFFKALAAFYDNGDSFSGAVAGAGFGFVEVVFIFLSAPFVSFVAVLERIFTVMFHTSSTSLVMFGKEKNKFLIFYVGLSLVHMAVDTLAVLFHMHYITLSFTEISAAAISFLLFSAALFLYKKKVNHIIPIS